MYGQESNALSNLRAQEEAAPRFGWPDRRFRLVWLDRDSLFAWIGQILVTGVTSPVTPAGWPADSRVASLDYDFRRQAYLAVIHSAEFEDVPRGSVLRFYPLFRDDH